MNNEQVVDEVVDDDVLTVPVIYADDSSEESEELETDEDDNDEAFEGFSDIEDINDMMSEWSCALVFFWEH